MKTEKILKQCFTDIISGKSDAFIPEKTWRICSGPEIVKDSVIIGTNYALYVIPEEKFIIDRRAFKNIYGKNSTDSVKKLIEDGEKAQPVMPTYEYVKAYPIKNKLLTVFRKEDGTKIYIQKEITDYFTLEGNANIKFRGTEKMKPLYVYENGTLQAVLSPVMFNPIRKEPEWE